MVPCEGVLCEAALLLQSRRSPGAGEGDHVQWSHAHRLCHHPSEPGRPTAGEGEEGGGEGGREGANCEKYLKAGWGGGVVPVVRNEK